MIIEKDLLNHPTILNTFELCCCSFIELVFHYHVTLILLYVQRRCFCFSIQEIGFLTILNRCFRFTRVKRVKACFLLTSSWIFTQLEYLIVLQWENLSSKLSHFLCPEVKNRYEIFTKKKRLRLLFKFGRFCFSTFFFL